MDAKLTKLLANIFDMQPQDINISLKKEEIAKWDSLTHMDLITTIEQAYSIELTMNNIVDMTSVTDIVSILNSHGVDVHE